MTDIAAAEHVGVRRTTCRRCRPESFCTLTLGMNLPEQLVASADVWPVSAQMTGRLLLRVHGKQMTQAAHLRAAP